MIPSTLVPCKLIFSANAILGMSQEKSHAHQRMLTYRYNNRNIANYVDDVDSLKYE